MTEPTLSDLLFESLAPLNEDDATFSLRKFCTALCLTTQSTYDIVRPRDDVAGWSVLLDPEVCSVEDLPYLAQYVGARLTPAMTEAQMREEIMRPTGWRRGEIASIEVAARRRLTGTQRTFIHENSPEVGRLYIRTLDSETPEPEATEADILTQVPAWVVLDYAALTGVTWGDVEASWSTWEDIEKTFATWGALEALLPEELPP